MKYEIDLPQLPDTHELVGHVVPQPGDLYLTDTNNVAEWVFSERGFSHQLYITARKKRTMADWANEQELFKALAKMRSGHVNTEAHLCDSANGHKIWQVRIGVRTLEQFSLPLPPDGCPGNYLVLRDGKWELA